MIRLGPTPCPLVCDGDGLDGGVLTGDDTPDVQRASNADVGQLVLGHGDREVLPGARGVIVIWSTTVDIILDDGNGGLDGDERRAGVRPVEGVDRLLVSVEGVDRLLVSVEGVDQLLVSVEGVDQLLVSVEGVDRLLVSDGVRGRHDEGFMSVEKCV
jgi:hypothetical protein